MMKRLPIRVVLALPALALIAACSGGGTDVRTPLATGTGANAPASTQASGAQFTITIPAASNDTASASQRHAQYVSTGTSSATIALTAVNGATPPVGYPAVTESLERTSPACVSTNGTLQCAISVSAPPGSDTFSITLSNSAGAALSANSETVTIVAGQNTAASPLVLGGIVATYLVQPATDAATVAHVSYSGSGFSIVGAQPYTFTASPVDASGAIIFGPGAPSVTLTSASADVTSTAVTGQLNKFTVQVKTQSATPIVLTAQSQGATALSVPITTAPEYFVADSGSDVIRAFAITSATAAAIPSDNIAISTNVNAIGGIALDPNGKLWVSDNYHQTVSQYTIGSATPITQFSSADNWQIAFDPGGNLWVGIYNGSYGYVEKVNSSGNVLLSNYLAYTNGYTLVAVSSGQDCSANNYGLICANNINGAGLFSNGVTGGIQALAFDPSGSIWYASSYGTGGAYSFNPISGVSTGTSIGFAGFVTTVGSIKFDIAGELLVLDSFNARISVWTPTNGRLYYISLPGCSNNVTDMAIVP